MRKMSNSDGKNYFALKYGSEAGKRITSFSELKKIRAMGNKSQIFATRQDLRQEVGKLDLSIGDLRKEVCRLDLRISETRTDLIREIGNLSIDMNKQIANLVKWVVGFGITIVLMFISLYLGK